MVWPIIRSCVAFRASSYGRGIRESTNDGSDPSVPTKNHCSVTTYRWKVGDNSRMVGNREVIRLARVNLEGRKEGLGNHRSRIVGRRLRRLSLYKPGGSSPSK